jgi:Flp pilus assembly protein TadG
MMVTKMRKMSLVLRGFRNDCRGVIAVEFALIAPVMLVLFFGVLEFSSGVAVDRKVALAARTLSDLTSQSLTVADTDLANYGQAAKAVMVPYSSLPVSSTVTEIYINPTTHAARVQWSRSVNIDNGGNVTVGTSSHSVKDVVTVPPGLNIDGTYLIWSEVSATYVPTVGYVMGKAGVKLSDADYTRPRQSGCVAYPTSGACPTL